MVHPAGTTQILVRRRVQLPGPSAALSTPHGLVQNNPRSWSRGCPFCLLSGGHNTVGSPFQESRGLHSSVGYRTTQLLLSSKAQSEDSRGPYLSHRMTQTRDDCASTRLPAACHSLQRAARRLEKRKRSLAWCVGDGATRLGPGRDPLQTVIKITLSAAQNRTAKIPVGSEEKMGSCPLWSGRFRILFHLASLWRGAASSKCAKSRHPCDSFLQNQSWLEKCIFRGHRRQ